MAKGVLGTKFFLDHFRFLDEFLGTDPTEIKMVLDYYIKPFFGLGTAKRRQQIFNYIIRDTLIMDFV